MWEYLLVLVHGRTDQIAKVCGAIVCKYSRFVIKTCRLGKNTVFRHWLKRNCWYVDKEKFFSLFFIILYTPFLLALIWPGNIYSSCNVVFQITGAGVLTF